MAVLELATDRALEYTLVNQALVDLGDLWSLVPDPTNGQQVKDVLTEYLPILIQQYSEPIAVQAAERFEQIRTMAGVRGNFNALLAPAMDDSFINSQMRELISPIFQGLDSDPDMALRNLEGFTTRAVLDQGRRTTVENTFTKRSGTGGFVRVPTPGKDHCGYCLLLATKVYKTKETAQAATSSHNRCFCQFVPKYEAVEIEGYNLEDIERRYKEAFENSPDRTLNDIAKRISEL